MENAREIIYGLGRAEITKRLKVSKAAITNAIAAGVLPSTWFGVVEIMCEEQGITVPSRELFSFVPDSKADAA